MSLLASSGIAVGSTIAAANPALSPVGIGIIVGTVVVGYYNWVISLE